MIDTLQAACGCDDTLEHGLVPVETAVRRGLALAEPVPEVETVALEAVGGRVLAEDAVSPLPLPPYDNAAMDGYALRLSDLPGDGPWKLPILGGIAAGEAGMAIMPRGGVLRILTGAPVPLECDAVVMQEHVQRSLGCVTIRTRPASGTNIRRTGEDLPAGAAILSAGKTIGPREAAALAATGHASVPIRRRVRVALFCTGSELRHPGETLGPGQIWNANRFTLRAALDLPWIDLEDLGTVPDTPGELTATLLAASERADLVISTGGVSVGDADHMPRLFREAGGDIHALRIALKPGKPLAIGRMGHAIYLGLPGNPVSAFVTWHVIGARIAERLAGIVGATSRRLVVKAGFTTTRRPGRCEFRPVRVTGYDASGAQRVELLSPSFSARIALLAGADGLAMIPAECDRIAEGDLLEFLPL
jgi:molybdopterin molybdotransferase